MNTVLVVASIKVVSLITENDIDMFEHIINNILINITTHVGALRVSEVILYILCYSHLSLQSMIFHWKCQENQAINMSSILLLAFLKITLCARAACESRHSRWLSKYCFSEVHM